MVKPDSVLGNESELIKITLGCLKRPHLKQKQNSILKQYDTKSKQTNKIKMRRIVSRDGALNGNVGKETVLVEWYVVVYWNQLQQMSVDWQQYVSKENIRDEQFSCVSHCTKSFIKSSGVVVWSIVVVDVVVVDVTVGVYSHEYLWIVK